MRFWLSYSPELKHLKGGAQPVTFWILKSNNLYNTWPVLYTKFQAMCKQCRDKICSSRVMILMELGSISVFNVVHDLFRVVTLINTMMSICRNN